MTVIITKLLPVILLIALGYLLKTIHFFKNDSILDFKKMVINIALPAILFTTFAKTKFDAKYITIIVTILIIEFVLLSFGVLYRKLTKSDNRYIQTIFTGFENGLMGYSMFLAVFGSSNMFKIAVVDIGNSLFLNAFLILYIKKLEKATMNYKQQAVSIVTTPTVIAIILGLVVSISGSFQTIEANAWLSSLFNIVTLLGNITTPIICIIVGYELVINLRSIKNPIVISLVRMAFNLVVAFLINKLVIVQLLHLDKIFELAVYTTFLLPPSFALSIFVKEGTKDENELIVNTISVHIILSIIAFMILLFSMNQFI